jgi:hypothetical protein
VNRDMATDPLLSTTSSPSKEEVEPLVGNPNVLKQSTSNASSGSGANASADLNPWATFVNGLYSTTSNLANLLPTGTFLAFTAIAPVITGQGKCDDAFEWWFTVAVVCFFGLFTFFSCFTDSYQAKDGKVYYGLVTLNGLWTPQLPTALHPGDKNEYKLTFMDVIHAILSLAVFAALTLATSTVSTCFYPGISEDVQRIFPVTVGFFVSAVFVAFPSKRHGIGFPVSPASLSFTSRELDQQKRELEAANGASSTKSQ